MGKVCLAWAENVLFADLGQLRCEIMDSYQITSAHDMHRIIEALREGSLPFNAVWTRTEKSLVREWRAKNRSVCSGRKRGRLHSVRSEAGTGSFAILCYRRYICMCSCTYKNFCRFSSAQQNRGLHVIGCYGFIRCG